MSNTKDFIIENGILEKYVGPGGDVVIPAGVTEIKSYAFNPYVDGLSLKYSNGRKSIKSVVIPESVTKIGQNAFAHCQNLKKVTASDNLVSVGSLVFHNTEWKKKQTGFITLNSVLIAYEGEDKEIDIPEGITAIADEAFTNCKEIVSVSIPGTVRTIGNRAFCRCTALEKISIPESVEEIGPQAFAGTPWLEAKTEDFVVINGILVAFKGEEATIKIPDTVKVIGPYVFAFSKTLEEAVIPESVTQIKESAFSSCKKLKTIKIPDSISAIADNLFYYCSELTKVSFSENVTEIGTSAFYGCENLEQLPNLHGVKYIGDEAFCGCRKLRDQKGRILVKDILFGYDNPGKVIEIPDAVTRVSTDAFKHSAYDFDDIEAVEQITASAAAFEAVWHLLKPKNKQAVAMSCLKTDTLHDPVKAYIKKNRDKLVPEIIRSDDADMMKRVFSLLKKPEPDMVEQYIEAAAGKVNVSAFLLDYKSKHFESAKIEQRREEKIEIELGLRERKLKDWKEIFKLSVADGCVRISGYKQSEPVVEIPESMDGHPVTAIGNNAFKGNTTIEQVILPAGLKNIDDSAFKGCKKLGRITIPEGVEELGVSAFEDCTALTSIDLPDSIQRIWANVFKGCVNLEKVHLPKNLNKITLGLFDGCAALKEIYLPDGITAIYDYSFRDCKVLAAINMPEKLEIIGQGAFTNCRSIEEIILPDGVKEIDNYAFRICTKLAKLRIPETAKKISPSAFTGCKKLTIHTPAGSKAANVAKKEKIPFIAE